MLTAARPTRLIQQTTGSPRVRKEQVGALEVAVYDVLVVHVRHLLSTTRRDAVGRTGFLRQDWLQDLALGQKKVGFQETSKPGLASSWTAGPARCAAHREGLLGLVEPAKNRHGRKTEDYDGAREFRRHGAIFSGKVLQDAPKTRDKRQPYVCTYQQILQQHLRQTAVGVERRASASHAATTHHKG